MISEIVKVTAIQAREEGAMCGLDGLLFESRRYHAARELVRRGQHVFPIYSLGVVSGFLLWAIVLGLAG